MHHLTPIQGERAGNGAGDRHETLPHEDMGGGAGVGQGGDSPLRIGGDMNRWSLAA